MAKSMTPSTMTEGQIERAVEIFRAQLRKRASELPSEEVQKAFGQPRLGVEWFEVLRRHVEVMKGTTLIVVDYSKSLPEMIAAGHYDWVNGDINAKRFPIVGEGVVQFESKVFHFNHDVSSENAERQIREDDTANPWEPAKIEHALAYGIANPEEQRKYPIIGLGSWCKVDGRRVVPRLHKGGSNRNLFLDWYGVGWNADCRFLAVRRIVTPS